MSMKVYLTSEFEDRTKRLSLDSGNTWTIGRSTENTLICEDHAISRRHGVVQQTQPGKYFFIDLGSSNGSSINGRRVTVPIQLRDGDCVVCGGTKITFHHPGGATQVPRPQPQVETEGATMVMYARRMITVLVVDIRDFTPLTRQLDEGILAQTIGTWFRQAGLILRQYHASGDKYIGDAVMAVWTHAVGKPSGIEIFSALRALAEIETVTRTLHDKFPLPAPLRIGAGINTGLSVMSNTGPQENPDFSPLGDAVNAAFRLETSTKNSGFDVSLGCATMESLRESDAEIARYFEKKSVQLKGYENSIDAWFTSFERLRSFLQENDPERTRS
ncbi:MAG TPA: adenylate/guanylate cyclase domain-containing protein [Terriglobales bacterium]|nr:adenylate/guanylate cyclase domain-containing protein [Terriglobales bacterium]